MKTKLQGISGLILLCSIIYFIFFYKEPPEKIDIRIIQKSGVLVKNAVSNQGTEIYTFSNLTDTQKVVMGFGQTGLYGNLSSEPIFKVVLDPHATSITTSLSKYLTSRILICELDCKNADFISSGYINAWRLRDGFKD